MIAKGDIIGVRHSPIAESTHGSIGVTVTWLAAAGPIGKILILTFITTLTHVSIYAHALTCDQVAGIRVHWTLSATVALQSCVQEKREIDNMLAML